MTSEEIIQILNNKQATLPCPACGHEDFTLVEGDFTQEFIASGTHVGSLFPSAGLALQPGLRLLNYIVLVCDNCGYLRQHAMKPLGITPKYRRI
jgi:predicted nucleic-acid-binding Zn-ribbon protein